MGEIADVEYAVALEAWRRGDVESALTLATSAVAMDPEHRPARLLLGYALLRADAHDAGLDVLTDLALEPADDAIELQVQRMAERTVRRRDDPTHRDQLSLTLAQGVGPERRDDDWRPSSALAYVLGVPVGPGLIGRLDVWNRPSLDVGDVGGWRVSPMIVGYRTSGRTGFDVGVGPTLWLANGTWWRSQWHVYVGARVAVGVDWRLGRRAGLRLEGAVMPHVYDRTLWWYRAPGEVRFGYEVWFGSPKTGRLTRDPLGDDE